MVAIQTHVIDCAVSANTTSKCVCIAVIFMHFEGKVTFTNKSMSDLLFYLSTITGCTSFTKNIFKPGVPQPPGFLELFLCRRLYVCLCLCVCVRPRGY